MWRAGSQSACDSLRLLAFRFSFSDKALQHSTAFLSWHVQSRSCIAYMAHLGFFFFLLCLFLDLIGSEAGMLSQHSLGVCSAWRVWIPISRAISYDLNIHVQLISLVLFFRVTNGWCDMGFVSSLRLAFQDISGWLFHARNVHQKKGFILWSISALRLLLHVHIWLQRTCSIISLLPIMIGEIVMFFLLSLRYLIPHVYVLQFFIRHRYPQSGHLYATWWQLKTKNPMNEIREKLSSHAYRISLTAALDIRRRGLHRPELAVWIHLVL